MIGRRDFLKLAAGAIAAVTMAPNVSAAPVSWPLWLKRGKDTLRIDVATKEGFEGARYMLRDIRGGDARGYPHLKLLQSLSTAQQWFAAYNVHSLFDIQSGMRLPHTNKHTEGASKASMHLPDKNGWFFATDFLPKGVDVEKASGWMRHAGIGGIGIYANQNFLHVDVGRPRVWRR